MSYSGKIVADKSWYSICLDDQLFIEYPEFRPGANVLVEVIASGTMLVRLVENEAADDLEDPMVAAFLAFIEKDSSANPEGLTPVSAEQMNRIASLTEGVSLSDCDELS